MPKLSLALISSFLNHLSQLSGTSSPTTPISLRILLIKVVGPHDNAYSKHKNSEESIHLVIKCMLVLSGPVMKYTFTFVMDFVLGSIINGIWKSFRGLDQICLWLKKQIEEVFWSRLPPKLYQ